MDRVSELSNIRKMLDDENEVISERIRIKLDDQSNFICERLRQLGYTDSDESCACGLAIADNSAFSRVRQTWLIPCQRHKDKLGLATKVLLSDGIEFRGISELTP
jgi:hypothetical protein